MTNDNCIFCNEENIKRLILDETENFYLVANSNPCSPGFVILISKKHFSCFGEMPDCLDEEYLNFLEKSKKKIRENFSEPIVSEQGIHGQSVNHAHTHIFPSVSEIYDFSKKELIDFVPKEIKITEEKSLQDIKRIFREEKEYVSIEEKGKLYVCHTKGHGGVLKISREAIARLTGLDSLLNWKTMSESEEKQVKKWLKITMEKLGPKNEK